jgi:ribonuclease H2 subunit B
MGKFRPLDDIVSIDGYPGYECLLPYLERSLEIICESRGGVFDLLCIFY